MATRTAGAEDDPPDGLDEVAEALYAGDPDDFVRVRGERVKQARAAGDRRLATAVGALRRPTRSAWTVNLLAREAADELGALLDLGEALREAQQNLSGPELRRLSAERHRAVEGLVRRAAALAADHGAAPSEAVRREVGQALQAALADPATGARVRAGRLDKVPEYGGFGPFAASPVPEAAAPSPTATRDTASRSARDDEDIDKDTEKDTDEGAAERERRAAARAEQARALRQALDEATRAREEAESELDDARTESQGAADDLAGLRDLLARAEQRAVQAEAAVEHARERVETRRRAESEAREALAAIGPDPADG